MKKVYYTQLAMISIYHEFAVDIEGEDHRISIPMYLSLIGDFHNKDLKESLYQNVILILGNDDFLLIPSYPQTLIDAQREDMVRHPHKSPIGDHEANRAATIGAFEESKKTVNEVAKEAKRMLNSLEKESSETYDEPESSAETVKVHVNVKMKKKD